jgi:hypothetical protein
MSGQLRRRYQRLLFTYPTEYRAAHGEEILGTLLEAARPTQRSDVTGRPSRTVSPRPSTTAAVG